MKLGNIVWNAAGFVGRAVTEGHFLKHAVPEAAKVCKQFAPEPERCFKGVPLSALTALAEQIFHGEYCSIDQWGFLVFHYKSNRGHQTLHAQMTLDEAGRLKSLGGYYPGQCWSTADEFVQKANEKFQFNA